jgi:hypothetical protein
VSARPDRAPTRRPRRAACLLLLLGSAAGTGCEGPLHDPTQPSFHVWLTAPDGYDQALFIRFQGPVQGFVPAPGFQAFPDPTGSGAVVVVSDRPLHPGEARLGTLIVHNEHAAVEGRVIEVARSDFSLRGNPEDYSIRLSR